MGKVTWTLENDRRLCIHLITRSARAYDTVELAKLFPGATSKAIEERIAKLKREAKADLRNPSPAAVPASQTKEKENTPRKQGRKPRDWAQKQGRKRRRDDKCGVAPLEDDEEPTWMAKPFRPAAVVDPDETEDEPEFDLILAGEKEGSDTCTSTNSLSGANLGLLNAPMMDVPAFERLADAQQCNLSSPLSLPHYDASELREGTANGLVLENNEWFPEAHCGSYQPSTGEQVPRRNRNPNDILELAADSFLIAANTEGSGEAVEGYLSKNPADVV